MKQSIAFTPSIIIGATLSLSAGFTTTTYAAEEAKKVERIFVKWGWCTRCNRRIVLNGHF